MDEVHCLFLQRQVEVLSRELETSRAKLQQAQANLDAIRNGEVDNILGVDSLLHLVPEEVLDSLLSQAERQAVAIFKYVGVAIITIDKKNVIQQFNPAAEKLFGYSAKEVIGQSISMLMFEDKSQGTSQDRLNSYRDLYVNQHLEVYAKKRMAVPFTRIFLWPNSCWVKLRC